MIRIRNGVTLDPKQRAFLDNLEFFTHETDLEVTRAHSTPIEQLAVIAKLAKDNKVQFKEFDADNLHGKFTIDGKEVYTWQQTWSRLLHIGVIVNPPLAAVCLEEYKGDVGRLIQPSPHILSDPVDFSGGKDIDAVYKLLLDAKKNDIGIRNVTLERKNNCCHVDLMKQIPGGDNA